MTEKISFNTKIKLLNVFKYILFFGLFFVFSKANINGIIFPFAFALLFSLMWCSQNVLIMSPLYIGACYLATFNVFSIYYALATVFVMLITYGIHYKIRKPMKPYLVCIYATLSQALFCVLEILGGANILFVSLTIAVGILFLLSSMKIFSSVMLRGFMTKLSLLEIICGALVVMVFFCGVSTLNLGAFEFVKMFGALAVLISLYVFNASTLIYVASLMGLGTLFCSLNPIYLCVFVVYALFVAIFKQKNRLLPCFSIIIAEILLGLVVEVYYGYTIVSVIPVLVACFIFLVIPNSTIEQLSGFFSTSADRLAMRDIVNRTKKATSKRLGELSDVFMEMNNVFLSMIKGGLSQVQAKEMLAVEVRDRVCKDCSEYNRCHRTLLEETTGCMKNLCACAFEKGRATLIDFPSNFASRCARANIMLGVINELSQQYKKYAGMMNNIDSSKLLIAEQLKGVSGIMKNLGKEIGANISYDAGRENKIIDELAINNIICSDCVVYEQNLDVLCVTIIIREDTYDLNKIEKAISTVCKTNIAGISTEQSPRKGWAVINLKTAPIYDVVFGSATEKKASSEKNGDTFSLMRIENDKFLLALCDGMGSGVKAESASNLAMGLVENFYKAGFDNDIILSSVNKLLTIGNEEVFSALDLCVVDLRNGICDLIKLGAPSGFIKHAHDTDIIESQSLPLGIVGSANPYIKQIVISQNDTVVLCTDGIYDSFYSPEDLADFINNYSSGNPQELANAILEKALENCKGVALDDMTVLTARIYRR